MRSDSLTDLRLSDRQKVCGEKSFRLLVSQGQAVYSSDCLRQLEVFSVTNHVPFNEFDSILRQLIQKASKVSNDQRQINFQFPS